VHKVNVQPKRVGRLSELITSPPLVASSLNTSTTRYRGSVNCILFYRLLRTSATCVRVMACSVAAPAAPFRLGVPISLPTNLLRIATYLRIYLTLSS
jgi:hypothetical protein